MPDENIGIPSFYSLYTVLGRKILYFILALMASVSFS